MELETVKRPIAQVLLEHLRSPGTWAVFIGALVIFPFLGSAGLWDPWETHYAEVARRMVADGDWLTPRWRNELFFSKPVLIFWMMASSFKIFGISALAARLPFALVGILGVFLAYRLVARSTDSRRGLLAAVVMATCPFYYFVARQAITDIVFCVFLLGCLGCFFQVALDENPRKRDIYGIYIFAALAALGKTPLGLAIPVVVVLAYLLLSGDWRVLLKMKIHLGIPLFLLIAAPWYATMLFKYGDKFFNEFFFRHNIDRAFSGVHGDRGTFEYFVSQLGYGFFPWVALIPLTFGRVLGALRERGPQSKADKLNLFLLVYFTVTFATFSLIVTKFHHYILPALPPLALLTGLALADNKRFGWKLLAPLGALLLAMVANDLVSSPAHLSNLHSYAYDRPLPAEQYPRWWLLGIAIAMGAVLLWSRFADRHIWPRRALLGLAAACTLILAWIYHPALGHTMSQKDLFDSYHRYAKPGDGFYQYQMNWRGEVFHSQDTIVKLSSESAVANVLKQDRRVFILSVAEGFAAVNRASRKETGKHLYVLPGSNLRYTLASNRLDPGVADLNPIAASVFSEAPSMAHPLRAEFKEGVAFLGYDLEPEPLKTGEEFDLILYFECLTALSKNWQVFIHIDLVGRKDQRIHGDHYPVQGLYPTDRWLPGDIVRDKVRLKVPRNFSPGRYTIYLGFYSDDPRMTVLPGFPQDGANRVRAGILQIQ